jgi:PfaB family protein
VLNPRTLVRPDGHELKRRDHELRNNLPVIAECGVGFACLFTKVFQDVFDLKANFALGYSMGEISMFAALGSWDTPGAMSERLSGSDTFNHRLAGELRTLRQLWGLDVAETTKEKLWETYTIKATYAQVQAALEGETRVYCTLISTPDSLVIGGYPPDCQRVFKKLGVRALCLDMANAIHSSPAHGEFEEMERLFTMEVNHRLDTRIYSSSCYLPVPQRTKSIANGIAKCLCDPVDFPRLVNAVYEKGARVFVEMGPGSSLGTWIERILKPARGETSPARPHSTILVNSRGVGEELTIFRAVAKLVSSGVQLNLHKFFQGSIVTKAAIWKT